MKLVLGFALSISLLAWFQSARGADYSVQIYDLESPVYLAVPAAHQASSVSPLTYVVRTPSKERSTWITLDSFRTGRVVMCDTNAVACIIYDDTASYLVVTHLSPAVRRDTVIVAGGSGSANWLNHIDNFVFSAHFLTLAYRTGESSVGDSVIIRKKSSDKGNWSVRLAVDSTSRFTMSHDFSQVLFTREGGWTRKTGLIFSIALFDLVVDSMRDLSSLTYSNESPGRVDRTAPLFYIKKEPLGGRNLWKFVEGSDEKQVTSFRPPEGVLRYQILGDSIVCTIQKQIGDGYAYRNEHGYSARN
jgi:hypothetical protein